MLVNNGQPWCKCWWLHQSVVISLAVSVIGEVEEGEGNSTYYSPPGQCLYRWEEYIIAIFCGIELMSNWKMREAIN